MESRAGMGVVVLLVAVLGTGGQAAQGQMFVGIGANQLDASGLNAVLKAEGVPALPETYLTFGAGGHGTIGRVYIGGGGYRISGFTASSRSSSASISGGGYGFFDVGYVALKTDRWRLYSYASIGGGQVEISVVKGRGRGGDPSVSGLLNQPGTSVDYSIGNFLVGGTAGVEYQIPDLYVRLGFEAGYRASVRSPGWSSDGIAVEDPPDIHLGGPFVRLHIGGNAGTLIIGDVLGGIFAS